MLELLLCVLVLAAVALFFITRPGLPPPPPPVDIDFAWKRRQSRRAGR